MSSGSGRNSRIMYKVMENLKEQARKEERERILAILSNYDSLETKNFLAAYPAIDPERWDSYGMREIVELALKAAK